MCTPNPSSDSKNHSRLGRTVPELDVFTFWINAYPEIWPCTRLFRETNPSVFFSIALFSRPSTTPLSLSPHRRIPSADDVVVVSFAGQRVGLRSRAKRLLVPPSRVAIGDDPSGEKSNSNGPGFDHRLVGVHRIPGFNFGHRRRQTAPGTGVTRHRCRRRYIIVINRASAAEERLPDTTKTTIRTVQTDESLPLDKRKYDSDRLCVCVSSSYFCPAVSVVVRTKKVRFGGNPNRSA